jgi:uncharacterized protein
MKDGVKARAGERSRWGGATPYSADRVVPLTTFLFKVASRCNLDCDYCYVYHSVDQSWKDKPRLMTRAVIDQALFRIHEHVVANEIPSISIVLHGGEPLLADRATVHYLFERATELTAGLCELELSAQSNGVLLSPEWVALFAQFDARIGISLDGPSDANRHRLLRSGRPSLDRVEPTLKLLTQTDDGRRVWSGFLAVIDPATDPIAVYDYLAGFGPRSIDFLLPHANHQQFPSGKRAFEDPAYGDWLIRVFDHWFHLPANRTRVRYFNNIIALLLGGNSETESLGHPPVNIVTIETNGELEAVDTLKVAFYGAPSLNATVFDNSFDDVRYHPALLSRMQGAGSLASECIECPLVDVCGGGYLPHRYAANRGFDNPSVYCHDIAKVVLHVREALVEAGASPQPL